MGLFDKFKKAKPAEKPAAQAEKPVAKKETIDWDKIEAQIAEERAASRKILSVNSDWDSQYRLIKALERNCGYDDVVYVESDDEALDRIEYHSFLRLIILDMNAWSSLDIITTIEVFKENAPDVPIILTSAPDYVVEEALDVGASYVFGKDYDILPEFYEAVKTLVG